MELRSTCEGGKCGRDIFLHQLSSQERELLKEEATMVAETFRMVCGRNSEEYRRTSFYRTWAMDGEWQDIERILAPLVEATILDPIHSWSHERCVTRYVEVLLKQNKIHEAKETLSRVRSAYNSTGRQLLSVERNVLQRDGPDHVRL